ncbi:LOW QUALITY PROTEIN: hypothetical protein TorRG33x02_068800 [Trema orientale]|uniref:Uncharacterized protein n=1 Tax=Trema orientale TaxID=63057 RepID=A0A2P5FI14_TREOI|nr:LOW QUALITY PROTEIN: hypothetical protein TorRG33x02_068800 [Trema orientale]
MSGTTGPGRQVRQTPTQLPDAAAELAAVVSVVVGGELDVDADSLVGVSDGDVEEKFEAEGFVGGEGGVGDVELQLVGVDDDAEDGDGEAGEDNGGGDDDDEHSQAAEAAAAFAALAEAVASAAPPWCDVVWRLHGGAVCMGRFL